VSNQYLRQWNVKNERVRFVLGKALVILCPDFRIHQRVTSSSQNLQPSEERLLTEALAGRVVNA
jgi:hypothetical protein